MTSLRAALRSTLGSLALVASSVACCANGTCIKDPPCKCGENPLCLSPVQRTALAAGTHALPSGPLVYSFEEKIFVLFSEKGQKDFQKDPGGFDEKGAIRLIRKGKTYRVDVKMKTEEEPDWASMAAQAVPYVAPPK